MASYPGRRTEHDAYEQAFYHGRTGSLSHPTDSKPLGLDNIIYLHTLRRMAVEWVERIDEEVRRVEEIRRRAMEQT